MSSPSSVTVFAPATVANVAVGFDILGFAIFGVGDRVTVSKMNEKEVKIEGVSGLTLSNPLPTHAEKNTAGLPLLKMLEDLKPNFGFSIQIEKGIPLGSGMGGSAASAVGAVVAAHELLKRTGFPALSMDQLLYYALEGEAVASGAKHADNVAPCLYGGLTLSRPGEDPQVISLPFPQAVFCSVVYPSMQLNTKEARAVLKTDLTMKAHTQQTARLAAFVAGCCTSNLDWIKRGLEDVLVEPQRASLIPGFYDVKQAAMGRGALGCSISGAGPSVFALSTSAELASEIKDAMINAFEKSGGLEAKGWISQMSSMGASVL